MAHAAGIMSDPGKPLRVRTPSRSAATKSGRNRNSPPYLACLACGGCEEVAVRLVAKLVNEDTEAARCVTETRGHLGRGEAVNEVGSEGLVLSVVGVRGLQEAAGQR